LSLYLGTTDFTVLQLKGIIDWPKPQRPTFEEVYVQTRLQSPPEVEDFVKRWRRLFVEAIKPRFLTQGWSINYPVIQGKKIGLADSPGAPEDDQGGEEEDGGSASSIEQTHENDDHYVI